MLLPLLLPVPLPLPVRLPLLVRLPLPVRPLLPAHLPLPVRPPLPARLLPPVPLLPLLPLPLFLFSCFLLCYQLVDLIFIGSEVCMCRISLNTISFNLQPSRAYTGYLELGSKRCYFQGF